MRSLNGSAVALAMALVLLLSPRGASACDLCSCNIVTGPIENVFQPGLQMGVTEQFTHFGTLQMDGKEVPNPVGQFMNSSITQVQVNYNVSEQVGIQVNVPFIHREFRRSLPTGPESGVVAGLGDATLTARFLPVSNFSPDSTLLWSLYGGLKAPTGSSRLLAEEVAEAHEHEHEEGEEEEEGGPPPPPPSGIHGHDLALGSGSWDGILGTGVLYRADALYLGGDLQYSLRTRGSFGYRYADDVQWNVIAGGYFMNEPDRLASLGLRVSGESKGSDDLGGVVLPDTSMTSLMLGPTFSYSTSDVNASLGVDIPTSVSNGALQTVPTWRVRGQVNWRL